MTQTASRSKEFIDYLQAPVRVGGCKGPAGPCVRQTIVAGETGTFNATTHPACSVMYVEAVFLFTQHALTNSA